MSWSSVISNIDDLLSEVINNILPATSDVDILVGFFYFSGFKWLYKELKDKKVRILVWMEAEQSIVNSVVRASKVISKQNTIDQMKLVFNNADYLDNLEWLEAIEVYISKIIDGSLEIRKTLEPNHAKLYIFQHEGVFSHWGTLPGTVINGSSNLTYSGLSGRNEFNTIHRDPEMYKTSQEMFDRIWNDESIPITTWGDDDEVVKMIKQETWMKLTKPYYCYLRILSEYFKDYGKVLTPSDLTKWKFEDLDYQTDAIKKGLQIMEEHSGVIIADVVWLWKSVIGSALLWNLWGKSLIIAPPHLTDGWNDYKKDFWLQAEIFSTWSIEKAMEYDSSDTHPAEVILIDEAHKFRNAETIDYGLLHQLCQGRKVILLTATPFNNEPNDIFNLIKLFQIPSNPTIHTKNGLISDFTNLQKKYMDLRKDQRSDAVSEQESLMKTRFISEEIKQIIWPVTVRRSRVDLSIIKTYKENLDKLGYEFSDVWDPKELNFDLWDITSLYVNTLEELVESDEDGNPVYFQGARYKVLSKYISNEDKYKNKIQESLWYDYLLLEWRQRNMPLFIRRLLVARFESSIYAFKNTLRSIISSLEMYEEYLDKIWGVPIVKKWGVPDFDELIEWDFPTGERIDKVKELLESKEWILIEKWDLTSDFTKDLSSDKAYLTELLSQWEDVDIDPKLDHFIQTLKDLKAKDPTRKIVVFSMFADTIEYLKDKLWDRVLVVTGWNKTEKLKKEIKLNFDAWVSKGDQKDDYDILLWTDAVSEWYNLHRAGVIINYDIPYNPTKVIQRIGRINRINKKVFDQLYVYNYFPSVVWEELVNTKKISTLKIKMIATIFWVDVKSLSADEKVESFYKKQIEKEDNILNEEESWDTKYQNDFDTAKRDIPDVLDKIENIPLRTRIKRIDQEWKAWVLLFAKKKSNLVFYFYDNASKEVTPLSLEEWFKYTKSELDEEPFEVSKDFYGAYELIKQTLTRWHQKPDLNTQQKKAYNNADILYEESGDHYFKILKDVIKLWALPLVYMKQLRNITEENFKTEIPIIKKEIQERYLSSILEVSQSYDDETMDLIISEQF